MDQEFKTREVKVNERSHRGKRKEEEVLRRSKQMGRSTWFEGPEIVAMGTKKMGKIGGIPCRRHHSECLILHLYSENK